MTRHHNAAANQRAVSLRPSGPGNGPGEGHRRAHRCRIPGCRTRVGADRLMCRPHWHQVPKPLRDRIWVTWRSGAELFTPRIPTGGPRCRQRGHSRRHREGSYRMTVVSLLLTAAAVVTASWAATVTLVGRLLVTGQRRRARRHPPAVPPATRQRLTRADFTLVS